MHLSPGDVGDWDRGVRALVGEDEFRGAHRVKCWLSSLAHWAMASDYRTNSFVLEPRIDNERYIFLSLIMPLGCSYPGNSTDH